MSGEVGGWMGIKDKARSEALPHRSSQANILQSNIASGTEASVS